MSMGMTKETFRELDSNGKLLVLYDLQNEANACACETLKRLEELEIKYNRGKKIDTGLSSVFGFIGGFVGILLNKVIKY